MATYQIHPKFSRTDELGAAHISATLFALDEVHDTRDAEKCAANPHTTQIFIFEAGTTEEQVAAMIQEAADAWAKSVDDARARGAL